MAPNPYFSTAIIKTSVWVTFRINIGKLLKNASFGDIYTYLIILVKLQWLISDFKKITQYLLGKW